MINPYRYRGLTLEYFVITQRAIKNGIKAEDYMPIGFDLTTDALGWLTTAQTAATTANRDLIFPPFKIYVSDEFRLRGNINYYNPPGGEQWIIPSSKTRYRIITTDRYNNGHVINFNMTGDLDTPEKEGFGPGEGGHCLSIYRSKNVTVWNALCKKPYGDGIYSEEAGGVINEDCRIINAKIWNPDRNGISIVSGINITIIGGYCTGARHNPAAAIDIEPNLNHTLRDIFIYRFKSEYNAWQGYQAGLAQLYLSPGIKDIGTILFKDCTDHGSYLYGMWIAFNPATSNNITGNFIVDNLLLTGARTEYLHNKRWMDESMMNLKFINPKFEALSGNGTFLNEAQLRTEVETNVYFTVPRPILVIT